jgi:uncharacterized repeat protein (TIGR01451 family)
VADALSMAKNTSVTFDPRANDSDPDGDTLTITSVSPTNGAASIVNGTNVMFTPTTNFTGSGTIGYTISDGTATATALITVTVTNRPPVAVADALSMAKNTSVTFDPRGNDSDPDGDALTVTSVSPTNGAASIVNGTNVMFTPTTNFTGSATIGYTISDGSSTATALITVSVTNRPPVAVADALSMAKNTSVTFDPRANDSDPDGDTLTITSVSPTNGAASIVNGTNVMFTPTTNFTGSATIGYTISDGSSTATALITVSVTNRPPVAVADALSMAKNTSVTFDPRANDSDPDGDTLTITSVSPTNGAASIVNGTNVMFTPTTNFTGGATIGYTISDGSSTATALITVSVTNRPPVAVADALSMAKNTSITFNPRANDSDPDGDALTITSVSPTNGAASIVGGTNVMFTPTASFTGSATIGYTISDGATTATALITVSVTNRPPVAVADAVSTLENTPITFDPRANDSDPDGDGLTITSVSATNGTANIVNGTNIVFTPSNNFSGTASITYTVDDGSGGTSTAVATVTVTPVADVAVLKTGPANVAPGDSVTYTISVTNSGPAAATNIVVQDQVPTNAVFVTASAGGVFSSNAVTWPTVGSLAAASVTNFTVTLQTTTNGSFTNIALASSSTYDPDPTNNDGSAAGSKVYTAVTIGQFGILAGNPGFNPQTGLFEEQVTVTNIGSRTVAAVELLVGGLRTNVYLYNAAGTNSADGRPYVQYNGPLDPGATVHFLLEFYDLDRRPFTNTLEAIEFLPMPATNSGSGGLAIDRCFLDLRTAGAPRLVIEFTSLPGRTYTIIYRDSMTAPWKVATPSVTANATHTQWYDDGPPKTDSQPLSKASRFYQVILAPANP